MSIGCKIAEGSGLKVLKLMSIGLETSSKPAWPPPAARWFSISRLLSLALGVSCLWAYWPTLRQMEIRWSYDPQYSHGYLVPVFSLFLLWHRRDYCVRLSFQGTPWGFAVVAAGVGLRLTGAYFYITSLEPVSFLVCLFGICLLLGGWNAVRWSWPPLAFLVFMIPLPYRFERFLAHPLQRLATLASTGCLEILGLRATAEGNIIWIHDEVRIGVVEACGGLTMLLSFFALAVAFAIILRRPLLDKAVLIASAIPIALLANVVRITLTAVLHELVGSRAAMVFFHDLAGWFMMLLALGMLWLELQVLSLLLVKRQEPAPLPVGAIRPFPASPCQQERFPASSGS
jgi:exosortase